MKQSCQIGNSQSAPVQEVVDALLRIDGLLRRIEQVARFVEDELDLPGDVETTSRYVEASVVTLRELAIQIGPLVERLPWRR